MKLARLRFTPSLFLLSLVVAAASLHASELHYLKEGKPEASAFLAPPPPAGSDEQKADLEEVKLVARSAPGKDLALARTEKKFNAFTFAPEIGSFFQPDKFPKTEKFLHDVQKDADEAVSEAKEYYKRPRPYTVDPTLASGKLETTFSYPSGHSTESMVLALVLADLFPAKHDAIIAEARQIGWHRVELGRHYPTDIYAGRVFAQAIYREMKANPDFKKDLDAAEAELAAAATAARN